MAMSRTLNSILLTSEHVKNHPKTVPGSEHAKCGSGRRESVCQSRGSELSVSPPGEGLRCSTSPTDCFWTSVFMTSSDLTWRLIICRAGLLTQLFPWLPVSLWGLPSGKVACWLHNPLAENISSTFPRPAVLSLFTATLSFLHPLPWQLKWTRVRSQGEEKKRRRTKTTPFLSSSLSSPDTVKTE